MAIVKTFEEFRPELMSIDPNAPINIISDHKNLQSFMRTKQLNRRQARWALFLSQFNFKIIYEPGKNNIVADALSRRKQDLPKDVTDERLTINHRILLKKSNITEGMINFNNKEAIKALPTDIEYVENKNKEIEYHAVDSDSDSSSNGNIDDTEVTQNYLDMKISTANLIQGAYENDQISKEIFEILNSENNRRIPKHLVKAGHNFSLADCQIKGCKDFVSDRRRLFVNKLLYVPNNDALKRRLYAEIHDHPILGHSSFKATYFSK
ncbi:hypothetical protein GcC1_018028, partial [Golovinomyces cichoracearum]